MFTNEGDTMRNKLNFLLGIVLMLSLSACSSPNNQSETDSNTTPQTEEDKSETVEESVEEEVVYADDKVVNQFIVEYNAITQSEFTDIKKATIRTKYFAYSYGYYCELLHANNTDKIHVSIHETEGDASTVEGMREIFHDVAKTIDPTLSDEDIYACFDGLVEYGYLKDDVQLGTMTILFSPDKELSYGRSSGHIEVAAQ